MADYALVVLRSDGLVFWELHDHQEDVNTPKLEGEFQIRRAGPFTPNMALIRVLRLLSEKGVTLDPEAVAVVRVEVGLA